MILIKLFWEFFKTGLFSIGGGLATLPFLHELSDKTAWFTHHEIADMLAVSESTPGPIGVNMATYVGYKCAGIPGGIVATLGLIAPSIIIILIIALFLRSFRNNRYVIGAFYGIRPASTALIASAGLSVVAITLLDTQLYASSGALSDLFDFKAIILAAILLILTRIKPLKKLHPVVFIAASGVVGAVFRFAGV